MSYLSGEVGKGNEVGSVVSYSPIVDSYADALLGRTRLGDFVVPGSELLHDTAHSHTSSCQVLGVCVTHHIAGRYSISPGFNVTLKGLARCE